MALEPITRQEKIIAGQDLTPITRMEMFLKNFGGSGGGSVPKPLTYDYMPEGYPSKAVQTITLMAEQEVAFAFDSKEGVYAARLTEAPAIAEGQTYTVNWDGTEYECVCSVFNSRPVLGNLSIMGDGDDTGEPFIYIFATRLRSFVTLDSSASHTISVKTVTEVITPMAYDYMPEGYPKKTMGTVTVMEEQELAFAATGSLYFAALTSLLDIVGGQTYTVKWDGTEHECVCSIFNGELLTLGNLSIIGMGSDTGEPFCYASAEGGFMTLDTAASHTISVKTAEEIVTPMAAEFLPSEINELIMNSSTTGSTKKFKITVDDSGTISATEVT